MNQFLAASSRAFSWSSARGLVPGRAAGAARRGADGGRPRGGRDHRACLRAAVHRVGVHPVRHVRDRHRRHGGADRVQPADRVLAIGVLRRRRLRRGAAEHPLQHVGAARRGDHGGRRGPGGAAARLGGHPRLRARARRRHADAAADRGRLRVRLRVPWRAGRRAAHRHALAVVGGVVRGGDGRRRPHRHRAARAGGLHLRPDPLLRRRARAVRPRRRRADRRRPRGPHAAPQAGTVRARLRVRRARRRCLRRHPAVRAGDRGRPDDRAGPADHAVHRRAALGHRGGDRRAGHPVPAGREQLGERQHPHRRGPAAHRGAAGGPGGAGRHGADRRRLAAREDGDADRR